jgi:hypothetical protein
MNFWMEQWSAFWRAGHPYFRGAIRVSIFNVSRGYRLDMRKASKAASPAFRGSPRESRVSALSGGPMRLDAETRSFLERPSHAPTLGQVLRVVVFTAAAIAMVKIGWIVAFYFIEG